MTKQKILLAIFLFFLGFTGILSLLTMQIPLPAEAEAVLKEQFSDQQVKLLLLVNPTILLIMAVALGTSLHQMVGLKTPLLQRLTGEAIAFDFISIFKVGFIGGLLSGLLLCVVGIFFKPFLPDEFIVLNESIRPTIINRFLYGGITEEILMRFGLMTFVVLVASKILKSLRPVVYCVGISLSAIIFAIGHVPIAFQALESPSIGVLFYILIGNSIGGIIFGWLYWKKGLESAFIAHMVTHVVLLLFDILWAQGSV